MEFLLDPVLKFVGFICGSVSRQIRYAKDIDRKVATFLRAAGELRCWHNDIQAEVQAAVSVGKKKLRQVENWLEDVDDILCDVASIESDFRQGGSCFSGRCPDLRWRLKLGKKVEKKMKVVEQLLEKGVFAKVAESPRRSLMPELPVPRQLEQQSTSQETLSKIEQALSDEEIGVVSVSGMGGIGKTTLMKKIYNRLAEIRNFDIVIWVTVSKDLNLNVIQEKIGNKLEVEFRENEGIEEKRDRLYARLRYLRYMLILDDLWQKFSLDQIGIPQPDKENRCKIAITTRSVEVSNGMEADSVIRMKTLSSAEAWDLFCSKTGDVVLQPEIQTLAKEVVKECGGLPLAIKTVGGAMRGKGQKELWQNALRALRAPATPEVPGMEREVFLPLKLSYDCLEDPKIQSCFLYCSLYPEDYNIHVQDIVRYWAFEEGLINNVTSLDDALNKGHGIIERLKDACLLEEGTFDVFEIFVGLSVRMHDVLRDLAIWIRPSNFLVPGEGLQQPPEEKMWEGMERISLMRNQITELQMTPNCPDLVSLLLRQNGYLNTIGDSFFQFMPKLQILDLRETDIKSLPPSLSLLVNLRVLIASHCKNLQEMPPLGGLKELQLLDLSYCGIEKLPEGIASLAKLKFLDLSATDALATIPSNMISGLTSLEDLRLWGYGIGPKMDVDRWREVATLRRLSSLLIELPSLDAFTPDDMNHPVWSHLSRFRVQFGFTDGAYDISHYERTVSIFFCQEFPSQIKSLLGNAEDLYMKGCQGMDRLSQIIGDSKRLKRISCHHVRGVKCAIDWRDVGENNALACLQELHLFSLPSLQKVFDGGLPTGFRQLRNISIRHCPKLRSIFSSSMFQHLHQLEVLTVTSCDEIEEIVKGGQLSDMALQKLSCLYLINLPKLRTICSQQLILTSLTHIQVAHCPVLKKLPISCCCMQEIHGHVRGGREWWEGIEWEDEHSKSLYSTLYEEITPKGRRR